MTDAERRELTRLLSVITPRLFDDDPAPALGRLRALAEKNGLHPTQFAISIGGLDVAEDLRHQLNEAIMASWRDTVIFDAACRAKGYTTSEQVASALNVPPSLVREWQTIGKVPAIFFAMLDKVPGRKEQEKDAVTLERLKKTLAQVRNELANVKRRLARALAHKPPSATEKPIMVDLLATLTPEAP
jgi:hypothetical protein